jgi:hypothetical protein
MLKWVCCRTECRLRSHQMLSGRARTWFPARGLTASHPLGALCRTGDKTDCGYRGRAGAVFYAGLVTGSGNGASRTKPMTQVISSTRTWACAL